MIKILKDLTAMLKALTGHGDQHAEYHVTAYALGLLKASAATPRVDHEERKKETKDKVEGKTKPKTSVPPVKKNVPVVTPKPTSPAVPSAPQSPAGEQRKITSIFFTDDKGHRITKAGYNSNIRVYIHSQNLIGSNFKLTVLDKDNVTNDILIDAKEYTFTGNATYVDIPLTVEMQEAGGDIGYQNLFVDIVVLATSKHLKSTTIDVDLKETKYDPITNTTKFMVEKSDVEKGVNCGEKYCIKKGDKSELIREINIRLAGFGGNVPTDEFTDRTEKMIKQFQRDYMKVPETGKVCGNVLRAIDEFQKNYTIPFDDIKCDCGECKGFGNEKHLEQYNISSIKESVRKYEYPGIHRSLVWTLRSVMFYTSVIEKKLGYTVKSISSGYRCHINNIKHNRNSTNHMGKALDIHFNKNGKRTQVLTDIEEIRDKIYIKYNGSQLKWPNNDKFSIEPTRKSYPGEFIATTWIHYDVREFETKYLDKKYFAKSLDEVNGKSILELAKATNANTCLCISQRSKSNSPVTLPKSEKNNFNVNDGKEALKIIYDKYGKDMAIIIERMYRDETAHFKSKQYASCGTGGMESHGNAPYYGWDSLFFESHPEFHPMGLWLAFENKGMSGEGGNSQVTDKKKKFVILPSVIAGMEYKAFYIKKYDGNFARWHSTNSSAQKTYESYLEKITPKFVNEFSK